MFFVRLGKSQSIMGALYKGLIAASVFALLGFWFLSSGYAAPTNGAAVV